MLPHMFRMTVDDVFVIRNRGLVATGRVEHGQLRVGDEVQINGGPSVTVDAIETFRKTISEAAAGDNIGVLFRSSTRERLSRGDVISRVRAAIHVLREVLAAENAQLRELVAALQGQVAGLTARLDALEAENTALRAENAELKRRLGLDSRNSSKPPSTDCPFAKPAPSRCAARAAASRAGNLGIRGRRWRRWPTPTSGCGTSRPVRRLRQRFGGRAEVGMEKRQVFDLPPMTVEVTEHQLIARRCACGATTCGTAPQGVSAPVQYGPRITAIVRYLYVGQFLSKKRAAKRWPSCSAPRSRRALSPRCPSARRRAGRVPRCPTGTDRRVHQCRVRRDRAARSRQVALGALRPHRPLHPDHLPPQTGPRGYRRRRRAGPVLRCRGARRLAP